VKILFDFQCRDCKNTFVELTEFKRETICECGGIADKLISAPRIALEGVTGDFPGAAAAWDKKHEQQLKKERKQAEA
jgi:putative FmdB family regulatory protein